MPNQLNKFWFNLNLKLIKSINIIKLFNYISIIKYEFIRIIKNKFLTFNWKIWSKEIQWNYQKFYYEKWRRKLK